MSKQPEGGGITWCNETWNPIRGCTRVSEGCRHCYAERVAARFSGIGQPYQGLAKMTPSGPRWTGNVRFVEEHLLDPLRWKRPRRIFVNSMSDLFHEGVSDEQLDRIFAVMALARRHTFQCLTKRPARMAAYMATLSAEWPERWDSARRWLRGAVNDGGSFGLGEFIGVIMAHYALPLSNVWLGVSVEDQATADERIPLLLETPAAVRWVSAEPLLAPVSFRWAKWQKLSHEPGAVNNYLDGLRRLNWIVVGGESGPGARPMQVEWARSLRDQCQAAGVPFFFKQFGEFIPTTEYRDGHVFMSRVGKRTAGDLLDGRQWQEYPRALEEGR